MVLLIWMELLLGNDTGTLGAEVLAGLIFLAAFAGEEKGIFGAVVLHASFAACRRLRRVPLLTLLSLRCWFYPSP